MADIKISQLGESLAVTDNDILPMTASGVTSKVKASTMKSYMVDDLDVSDLHDTTITTPTNNDGLVYNGTSQKWENKQITTKEQWKKNGAYNLCPNTASSTVGEGITYTVNSDGTVTAGGGVSVNNWGISITTGLKLRKGTYKLCGTPSGGNYNTTYSLYVSVGGVTVASDTPNTVGVTDTFTVSDETASYDVTIIVRGGIDLTTPITFKPMITTDLNATYDDYVPYAKTNRQLTDNSFGVTNRTSITVSDLVSAGGWSAPINGVLYVFAKWSGGNYINIIRNSSQLGFIGDAWGGSAPQQMSMFTMLLHKGDNIKLEINGNDAAIQNADFNY